MPIWPNLPATKATLMTSSQDRGNDNVPGWAPVAGWWCVTSLVSVGSCPGPRAAPSLAPSACTAAVYRCISSASPAGSNMGWAQAEKGLILLASIRRNNTVSMETRRIYILYFLIKVIRTDTTHHLLNMHFCLSSVYLRGNEVHLFI